MTYDILAALVDVVLVATLALWVWLVVAAVRRLLFDARDPERPDETEPPSRSNFARCGDCHQLVWPAWACCPSCGADLGALG